MKFVSNVADKLLGLVGQSSPLPQSYMRLCAVPFFYANNKIKEELGWQPRADFKKSVRDMMLWHKEKVKPRRNPPENSIDVKITSTDKLKVGIVGCGVISGPHLDALAKIDNAEVVAACDPFEAARDQIAQKYNIPQMYASHEEMLEKQELDVIHICSPAQNHAPAALAAIEAGCHVLIEKPMTVNAAEATKIVAAAKKKNVVLSVDHNHVYDEVMVKARSIIASGAIGSVSYVESWYGTSYSSDTKSRYLTYEAKDNWAYDMPGALYQNFISHPISLLMEIMGDAAVKHVHSKFNRVVPHMATDELRVTFENETTVGMLHLSMAVSPRYLFVNVFGTEGTLKIDLLNKTVFLDKPNARLPRVVSRSMTGLSAGKMMIGSAIGNFVKGLTGKYNMYQGNETLVRLFYRSILEGGPNPVSGEEGLRSMEIMDEVWRKMTAVNGQAITKPKPATKTTRARKTQARKTATRKATKKG
jgi:predicted dehydrogenase